MQFSLMKSTMPLACCTIAPGDGQAFRQPGSAQCMQPSLRISHSRPLPDSTSAYRITVQEFAVRSIGLSRTPWLAPMVSRVSFHSMHATWQALQPMHFEMSISLATSGVWRWLGEGVVVAERRVMSRDCSAMIYLLCLLDVDEKRLELRCLGVCVAHERGQGVGQVAALGKALEAPVDRYAHVMDGLAVDLEGLDALGDHRHGLDKAPAGPHLN